ncbi:MAG: hypothetical protein ABI408_06650 [Gemmatimonadaceae bacterium]
MGYREKALLTRIGRLALASAAGMALTGCVGEPVQWGDVTYRVSQLGDPDARSAVLSANLPLASEGGGVCLRSIRTAKAGSELFRIWWTSRSDSSVMLYLQHSRNGGASWDPPAAVETRDRGRRGCARPAPGVFYDPARGYLHLVYFIEAADGAGVFFAHSMDKGSMFHSPVPVVYGNSPAAASVAANGDSVVVVFEDPNATAPRIGIVLSHSTGHIFETRGDATPDDVPAVSPWVVLDHRRITVWWKPGENVAGQRGDRVGYRVGRWN